MNSLHSRVRELAKKLNATILAHNYQRPEVQDVADYVGDSLELSIKAMRSNSKIIVFAGVDFMVEQASILAENCKVLHPEPEAICPMAWQLKFEVAKKYREKYSNIPFIVYVNSLAEVKAIADYVVTSSSAVKLISQLDSETVLFGPDSNLASYVEELTGKRVIPVPEYGFCPMHIKIKPEHVLKAKRIHPRAKVLVHPECIPEVRRLADFIGSTSQIVRAVGELEGEEFIIGTEPGILHRIRKEHPEKRAYPALESGICPNMKKITLEKIEGALVNLQYPIEIERSVREKVKNALERSFELLGVEIPWKK